MATSLMLLCAAGTRMARVGGFAAADEPLDDGGRRDAAACTIRDRFRAHAVASPAVAAMETAAAMGLAVRAEPALADADPGDWGGRAFADLPPDALMGWLADPAQGAPGGESLAAVQARVGGWVDAVSGQDGATCAISHAMVIRAALIHALGLPADVAMRIDIAPLAQVHFSFHRQWRLQAIVPPN